jgi:hypothetical protein
MLMLERGASADLVDPDGFTVLLLLLTGGLQNLDDDDDWNRIQHLDKYLAEDGFWPLLDEVVRRSSTETRRAVVPSTGLSAADHLVDAGLRYSTGDDDSDLIDDDRFRRVLLELLASGAPIKTEHAAVALPIVASRDGEEAAELAARRSESHRWRAHDDLVSLALDMVELKEAERAAEERQARVLEHEREVRELGVGTESSSDDGDGDDGSGSDESEGESGSSSDRDGEREAE